MTYVYREARSVAESSEGLTASKSDCTGRNPGMTRLVRRSNPVSGGTAFFSLVQIFRQRMRKCSGSPIPTIMDKSVGEGSFILQITPLLLINVGFSRGKNGDFSCLKNSNIEYGGGGPQEHGIFQILQPIVRIIELGVK